MKNVTKTYRKINDGAVNVINREATEVTKDLEIHDHINILPLREAYMTLKDD